MNKLTHDIAQWLAVDLDTACKVQDHMSLFCGSVFSRDSTRKLKKDARTAYEFLQQAAA